jgi:uncharacterized protein DUF3943
MVAAALLAAPTQAQTPDPPQPDRLWVPQFVSQNSQKAPAVPVATTAKPHPVTAGSELFLLEAGTWAFNRYISKADYAVISLETIKTNIKSGFHYDRDNFTINQSGHPYHGSLFYTAGRSNGYGFWLSGVLTLTGSLIWECCMENTQPSINDLINTTLGGMTRGEISHRLTAMLRDNTVDGSGRFWREAGGALIDPVGAFTRLVDGDLSRSFQNPQDRLPSRFTLAADIGYRSVGGTRPNQAMLSFNGFYGDPFAGEIQRPFDSFWMGIDFNSSPRAMVSRIEERGILKGWELGDRSDSVRHVFGVSQEYQYFNNEAQVFGAQIFGLGVMSRYRVGTTLEAVSDVGAILFPLAGVQTTDFENPDTGRNYDYVTGGGLRLAGRLFRRGREILAAGYELSSAHTDNGTSDHNTLQNFRASARVPLFGPVGIGTDYSWYSRRTIYTGFFEGRQTQREWRVFLDVPLAQRRGVVNATGAPR